MASFMLNNGSTHISLDHPEMKAASQRRNLLRIATRQCTEVNPRINMEILRLEDEDFIRTIMEPDLEFPVAEVLKFYCRNNERN